MNGMHLDEIELLNLAFPDRAKPLDEERTMHALSCCKCMEAIMTMREMSNIMSELREENAGYHRPDSPAVAGADYTAQGYAGPLPAAAAAGNTNDMAYLDIDDVASFSIPEDGEDDVFGDFAEDEGDAGIEDSGHME